MSTELLQTLTDLHGAVSWIREYLDCGDHGTPDALREAEAKLDAVSASIDRMRAQIHDHQPEIARDEAEAEAYRQFRHHQT